MKKVIFGILSIFLISPVFAEDYFPSWTTNTAISFESVSNSSSLTYYIYGDPRPYSSKLYYSDSNNNAVLIDSLPLSSNQIDFGSSISESNLNDIFGITNNFGSYLDGGYFLLSLGVNSFPVLGYSQLYFQRVNSSGSNFGLTFGSNNLDYDSDYNIRSISDGFVRYFYNTSLGFTGFTPTFSSINGNPVFVEVFAPDLLYTITNRGRVYDYASKNNITKNFVVPSISVGYGYEFISGGVPQFHTVFPFYSFQTTGTYTIPGFLETDKFMFFSLGDGRNVDNHEYGAISYTGGVFYFSHYYCGEFSFTEYGDDGLYYLNLSESCEFLGGGILENNIGGNAIIHSCVGSNLLYLFTNSCVSYYGSECCASNNSLYMSFYYSGSNLFIRNFYNQNILLTNGGSLSYKSPMPNYSLVLTNDSSVNIISGFNNAYVPLEPLTTGTVTDVLDILCKTAVIKPPYCKNGGLVDLTGDLEGMWYVDLSGNLVYTIIGTDPDNLGSFDLVPNGSGGFDVICTDDLFGCTLSDNLGLSGATIGGSSGFILSSDYYEEFFTKTGYWGKCPYPYTDINVGLHSKFLNKIGDKLGFDVFLPVNCSIAAFTHGKNYKFLSDVNLGLSPLMGQIQGSDDPRVYLYRFFDFLLSLFLIVFLLKLYHLLN